MSGRWPETTLAEAMVLRDERPAEEDLLTGRVRIVSKIAFEDGRITFRGDGESRTGMILIRPGDLLVSGINAHKGAIALYDSSVGDPAAATIHYSAYSIRQERADRRFLWYLLRSEGFRSRLQQQVPGGIKTELKSGRLLQVMIPLPPLPEQRRIVARIEAVVPKLDEARSLRAIASKQSGALVGSWVEAMFRERRLTRPESALDDYILESAYGTSRKTDDDERGTPILGMSNIQSGRLKTTRLKYLHLSEQERRKLLLKQGDILVNRTNSAELVGKCAVFELDGEYAFASYLIRLRLDTSRAEPRLVAAYINSPSGRAYMFRRRKQMTGQANVNTATLKALPISLPPSSEQTRLVARLDDLEAQVDALRSLQAPNARTLDHLLASVVHKAFEAGSF